MLDQSLIAVLVACLAGCTSTPPAEVPEDKAREAQVELPSWCEAIESATSTMTGDGFRCLPVPNFLLTGFFGPEHNPERSDFENACFGGNADAASRLRMSVRPAASLHFELHAEQRTGVGGKLDLGFLGPWAPELGAASESGKRVSIDVALDDAEIRVLSSVAEILGQQYEDAEDGTPAQQSLEACIASICADGGDDGNLLYTAKVLAAAPVIRVETHDTSTKSLSLAAGVTRFSVDDKRSKDGVLVLRAKEKLNVAALLEGARPAFERAKTCERVSRARARRRVLTGLREVGLGTLAGRALADVPGKAGALRKDVTDGRIFRQRADSVGRNPGRHRRRRTAIVEEQTDSRAVRHPRRGGNGAVQLRRRQQRPRLGCGSATADAPALDGHGQRELAALCRAALVSGPRSRRLRRQARRSPSSGAAAGLRGQRTRLL